MSEVRYTINKMFAKYPKTAEAMELKEEIIGNLEAEIEDLQNARGLTYKEALHNCLERMEPIDGLIEGVQSVSLRNVLIPTIQTLLIYLVTAWILATSLSMFEPVRRTSFTLFLFVLMISLVYGLFYVSKNVFAKKYVLVNLWKLIVWRKYVWIIWSLYVVVRWGLLTAVLFGSNLWFARAVHFDGPYEFAVSMIQYVTPLMTIIIPLLFQKVIRILEKEGELG